MDPKATAKSKRTHTLHGRRNHPPSAAAAAARQKQANQQQQPSGGEGSTGRARRDALPSNWDRYGSDEEEQDGDGKPAGAKQADAEVQPKSKGADFSYLIEQARSQPQEVSGPVPESSSFGEFPLDFMQGVSSMLSVRGENLMSLCRDDNFIVDDDPTSTYEVPFFSLDLHALAAQLSKLKLSQRLFIEPDLIPEELCADEVQIRIVSGEQSETTERSELRDNLDPPSFIGHARLGSNLGSQDDIGISFVSTNHEIVKEVRDFPLDTQLPENVKPVPTNYSKTLDQPDRKDSTLDTKINTISELKLKSPGFEAAAAEAELDMLLDSFGQSSLSILPTDSTLNNRFPQQSASTVSSVPINLLSTSQDPGSSSSVAAVSLNDTIDDLLAETSASFKDQRHKEFSDKEGLLPTMLPLHFPRASEPMHASSSSKYVPVTSLDDLIDDLLEETSLNLDQKQTARQQVWESLSINPASQPTVLASKPIDDFDSWLDTL